MLSPGRFRSRVNSFFSLIQVGSISLQGLMAVVLVAACCMGRGCGGGGKERGSIKDCCKMGSVDCWSQSIVETFKKN